MERKEEEEAYADMLLQNPRAEKKKEKKNCE